MLHALADRGEVRISGKTGTFHGGIKNEVGVVDFGEGDAYAVAVFVRQHDVDLRDSAADAVIGTVARIAIDDLRVGVRQPSPVEPSHA